MIIRTIYATIEMACCRDGDIVYHPLPRPIEAPQAKEFFKDSLVIWRDKAEKVVYDKYYQMAELECMGMGTPRLCLFNFTINYVDEFESLPELPKITTEELIRISEIEKLIESAITEEQKEKYRKIIEEIKKGD